MATDINEFLEWSRKTWQEADDINEHANAIHAALGLSGEAGEVVDIIKKLVFTPWRLTQKGVDALDAIEDELGDVLYYWVRLCDEFGLDPQTIIERVTAKLKARYGA
jgi:NTP pyrophosphatase (non-canonical NTP hydrolase)